MDIVELYERALDQAGQIVAGVSPDQFGLPTPCSEWDVRTLLEHVVGGNWNSAAAAEGPPPQRGGTDDLPAIDRLAAFMGRQP